MELQVTSGPPQQLAEADNSRTYYGEQERLLALQALDILDSEAEPEFEDMVQQAARLCAAPVACISFLDETRQWIKAQTGSWLPEIPRTRSFCARTLQANDLLLLDAMSAPALFAATPLTYHDTPVVAYAGYPIRTGEGYVVGVLSVSDVVSRTFSPEQQQFLQLLAQQVSQALALRLARRARLAAEASVQRKQAFLAAMSHEIRTPIHGIMGLSRLLQESFITPQQEENLAIIASTAENLLNVINDILDFSKVELGKMELERVPFDVEATVRDATRSVQHMAQKKGISLQTLVQSPGALPIIEGDPLRLRQILLNLLTNALKFTEEGQITVSVEVQHQDAAMVYLEFCVDDTGIGISMDKAEEIFRAFDQATSSTARRYGGTGLGLAICRSLIELQGGRIWLEGRPGQGSCFRFSLAYPISAARPYAEAVLPRWLRAYCRASTYYWPKTTPLINCWPPHYFKLGACR
ncbi:ATP-binding protein [Hymenobacter sp. 5516J-16]|uniref:sensor histidine kinase n=1 Tax=Hymenobacter sp. 5516J-16 TaxID=2932253 RepID=UPI001FD28544|nr:ATP-binding protein [Hymenobacter sp. 5516J-16]UOQ77201.1 ATP-binding protein [Hymenobacter sp. 5516J-16]